MLFDWNERSYKQYVYAEWVLSLSVEYVEREWQQRKPCGSSSASQDSHSYSHTCDRTNMRDASSSRKFSATSEFSA